MGKGLFRAFIIIVFFCMLYPLAGYFIDKNVALSGVTAEVTRPQPTVGTVMDGSFQSEFNTYIENDFPGRKFLLKVRNQLMYSILNESPNANIVIGKESQLFEPRYILRELGIEYVEDQNYFSELIAKLESLQTLLNENGKELYIFITPSKAYFYKDYIPDSYLLCTADNANDYKHFTDELKNSNLHYFDSRSYIEKEIDSSELKAPIFYSTGTHWSTSWGHNTAIAFADYINEHSKWELSTVTQTESPCALPEHPDADLFQTLNLLDKQSDIQYYTSSISIVEQKDTPNVFLRGTSYMGNSLSGLVRAGVFAENVHFENSYFFTDQYANKTTLSRYDAYDEYGPLEPYIKNTDILILEVNEVTIHNMSFGFIDYLLQNPGLTEKTEG